MRREELSFLKFKLFSAIFCKELRYRNRICDMPKSTAQQTNQNFLSDWVVQAYGGANIRTRVVTNVVFMAEEKFMRKSFMQ